MLNIRTLNKRIAPAIAKDGGDWIDVDPPDGQVSKSMRLHYKSYPFDGDGAWYSTRQEAYEDILEDWSEGCDPCDETHCEICEEAND